MQHSSTPLYSHSRVGSGLIFKVTKSRWKCFPKIKVFFPFRWILPPPLPQPQQNTVRLNSLWLPLVIIISEILVPRHEAWNIYTQPHRFQSIIMGSNSLLCYGTLGEGLQVLCKEKLLLISPRVWNAGGQRGRGWVEVGQEVVLKIKMLLFLSRLWSSPNGKLTSQRGGRMRGVVEGSSGAAPPGPQVVRLLICTFLTGSAYHGSKPLSFRGVTLHPDMRQPACCPPPLVILFSTPTFWSSLC